MVLNEPLDYEDARQALKAAAQRIRDAEELLEQRFESKALAERDYRRKLSERLVHHRSEGKGAGESEVLAKGDVADLSHARDLADGMVRVAHEILEDRRGDRASLHKICEWSQRLDAFAQRDQARAA